MDNIEAEIVFRRSRGESFQDISKAMGIPEAAVKEVSLKNRNEIVRGRCLRIKASLEKYDAISVESSNIILSIFQQICDLLDSPEY